MMRGKSGLLPRAFLPDKGKMQAAIALAVAAGEAGEIPVGAVVEKNGVVLGSGRNRREEKRNAILHAEIEAIQMACSALSDWRLDGCSIYVTLEPCPMCMGAILSARICRVIYAAADEKTGYCGSAGSFSGLPAFRMPEVFPGFMEEQCRELLPAFFSMLR